VTVRSISPESDAVSRYLPEGDLRSYPDAQASLNLCTEAVTQGHTRSLASSPVAADRRRCNTPSYPQLQTISVALPFPLPRIPNASGLSRSRHTIFPTSRRVPNFIRTRGLQMVNADVQSNPNLNH